MLITVEDIRKVRQVAKNIDPSRIDIYIREAESLDVIPYIGVEMYQRLHSVSPGDLLKAELAIIDNPYLEESDGLPVVEWKILNGGCYRDSCGTSTQFGGLKLALSYLAYARFIQVHSVNVSAFGVVSKMGDNSTMADSRTIAALSSESKKIGQEYLRQTLEYCRSLNHRTGAEKRRKKFIAIGD